MRMLFLLEPPFSLSSLLSLIGFITQNQVQNVVIGEQSGELGGIQQNIHGRLRNQS